MVQPKQYSLYFLTHYEIYREHLDLDELELKIDDLDIRLLIL